ncbi:MAG: MATE family efflux transporter, partial [Clostridiales Family XIII bacterium]|nr:MATE family efflux transporter [Clostridiales Family XIII bacterium]
DNRRNGGDAATRLGVEPVGKLLLRFSLPAMTGMIVNALYNIVDRIFVGRAVGEAALGGLALVMPVMTVVMAFSVLFGIGAANLISMRLGQERREEAENALNHCFWLLILSGALLTVFGVLFIEPILSVLGAQDGSESIDYARRFLRIILFGSVFFMMGLGFSHCTRAQGFPTVSMLGFILGAVVNVTLVPIFLFVLRWNVEGAAIGTVIAQGSTVVFILAFGFSRKAVLRLRPFSIKPSLKTTLQIISFGSAQFLLQFAMSFVMLIYNISMSMYGVSELGSASGGDVALSGMNIVNSINMLIVMPIFGINQGAQPLLGFNYGAKKFGRVIGTYARAVIAATVIGCIGFALLQLFPDQIVRVFAPNGSREILSFTPAAMRIATLTLPIVGFQVVSANMFVVTGRPKTSMVLSMMRQFILLIPCIFVFGKIWGLSGVIAAAPAADTAAVILTTVMIVMELKKLRAQRAEEETRE